MAWTAPRTWVTGEIVTAAMLNTHVRDNLLAGANGAVTTAGDLVYATGANALARLPVGTARQAFRVNAGATAPEWVSTPSCRVYHNAAQALTNAAALAALAFNSERFDPDAMHDTVTNNSRITIAAAGVYVVTAGVQFTGASAGFYEVGVRLNGTATYVAHDARQHPTTPNAGPRITLTTIYKLAAADYLEVMAAQNTGTAISVDALTDHSPVFGVAWLSAG